LDSELPIKDSTASLGFLPAACEYKGGDGRVHKFNRAQPLINADRRESTPISANVTVDRM
jgi:hypothetical protein